MISHYFTNIGNIINSFDLVVKSDIQTRKINDFIGIIDSIEPDIETILSEIKFLLIKY